MSKYNPLWAYILKSGRESLTLTFAEIERIAGVPIDHSFLRAKKELAEYGYSVGKISMKAQTVIFDKTAQASSNQSASLAQTETKDKYS